MPLESILVPETLVVIAPYRKVLGNWYKCVVEKVQSYIISFH